MKKVCLLPLPLFVLIFSFCSKETSTFFNANFTYDHLGNGQVFFENRSSGANRFEWDFGDGNFSIEKNPTHTYSKNVDYSVKLTAYTDGESSTHVEVVKVKDASIGVWRSQSMNFPGERRYFQLSFQLGNNFYYGGGYDMTSLPLMDFWSFNLLSKTWERLPDLPLRFGYTQCHVVNGIAYLGLSTDEGLHKFFKFDENDKLWIEDFNYDLERYINAPAFSFVISDFIYFGFQSSTNAGEGMRFIAYDPVNKIITDKASYPAARRWFITGFADSSRGFAGAGAFRNGPNNFFPYDEFYSYSPEEDTWKSIGKFPGGARYKSIAFEINGNIFFGMGQKSRFDSYNDLWIFNSKENSWELVSKIPDGIGDFRFEQSGGLHYPFVIKYENEAWLGGGYFLAPGWSRINTLFYQLKFN